MKNLSIPDFVNYIKDYDYNNCNIYVYDEFNNSYDYFLNKEILEKDINKIYNQIKKYKYIGFSFLKNGKPFLSTRYSFKYQKETQLSIHIDHNIKNYEIISRYDKEDLIQEYTYIYEQDYLIYKDFSFVNFKQAEKLINNFIFL